MLIIRTQQQNPTS